MSSRTYFMIIFTFMLVVVAGIIISVGNSQPETEATEKDLTYSTVEELNSSTSMLFKEPEGATDIKYSSQAVDGKIVGRVDFKLDGFTCFFVQKTTMMSENISGIERDWENETKVDLNGLTWTLQYNDDEGLVSAYDGSNGWMMKCLYEKGDGVSEETLTKLIESATYSTEEEQQLIDENSEQSSE
ncbi:MAG: hypothetical protein ACOYIK_10485 [Coriobacteriales bacterium]|jgi:hypothetical protein